MADHDPDTAPTQHPQSARGTLPAFIPVPRAKERSNGWKPQVQRAFIEAEAIAEALAQREREIRAYHRGIDISHIEANDDPGPVALLAA